MPAISLSGSNLKISCEGGSEGKLSGVAELCKIALDNELYVHGWTLKNWYQVPERIWCMAIAYNEFNVPVGSAARLLESTGSFNFGVWVHKWYRRQGIGTELVRAIREATNNDFRVQTTGFRLEFYNHALKA